MTRITIEVDSAGAVATSTEPEGGVTAASSNNGSSDPYPGAVSAGAANEGVSAKDFTLDASAGIDILNAINAGPAPANLFQAGQGGAS